jgi:hypothetical protein
MLVSLVRFLACSTAAALRPTDAPRTTNHAATRRQSFAAAAALIVPTAATVFPTAATAATAEQVERAAKQGILKCFEKRDDKLVNVCKLQEIEERKAHEGDAPRQVTAEVPVDMDALRVAREKAAEKRASIKLRETPEWLSGSKSGEAGVAARERLPGPFGGGKRKAPPKKKEKSDKELRAAAEAAAREAAAAGLPEDWVEVTDDATGRIFYGNVKTGATQFERPQ